jgi:hypothetical protein
MYLNAQTENSIAPFITDHDLDKMSDHVFETYDFDGSGKTFKPLFFNSFTFLFLFEKLGKLVFEGKQIFWKKI